jgi:hypothetical protein
MVFDRRDVRRLWVEARATSTLADPTTHELLLDWDGIPLDEVPYPAGDRWVAAQEALLEVAARAAQMGASVVEHEHWGRIMLRVPGGRAGPVRDYILEMRRKGNASLWLRGDILAERFWLPVDDSRMQLDCVSSLALVFGNMLEEHAGRLGRPGSERVHRRV